MHASGLPVSSTAILLLLTAPLGCRSSRSDHTVQVTQAPAAQQAEIQPPPSRLANAGGSDTALQAMSDGSGAEFAQLAGLETSGMIDGEGEGASRAAFLEAFRDADPQVREAFRRRLAATVAKQPLDAASQPSAADAKQATSVEAEAAPGAGDLAAARTERPAASSSSSAAPDPKPADSSAAAESPARSEAAASAIGGRESLANFELPSSADAAAAPAEAEALVASRQQQEPEQPVGDGAATDSGDGKAVAAEASPDTTSDAPAASPSLADAQLLEKLIDRWAEAAADETETAALRRQLKHRILLTLHGKIDQAVQPIPGMDASEQEYLRHQLLALWTAIDPEGHPVPQRRWAAALPQLREATNYLAAATGKLEVRGLSFCTEVLGYGMLTPFDSYHFTAGQEVLLYSELENFAAERLSDGYETHFQGAYEVFDRAGKRVADNVLPPDQQVCNNYRRDYFIAYRLHLPSHLAAGRYRMEVTMEDLKGKKYGQSSIEFEIVQQR